MPKKTIAEMIAELEAELKGCESPSDFREWQLQLASLAESYLPTLIVRLKELMAVEKCLPDISGLVICNLGWDWLLVKQEQELIAAINEATETIKPDSAARIAGGAE